MTTPTVVPAAKEIESWLPPDRGKVAMICLIIAESAIFTIFVVAYIFYTGKSLTEPKPGDVLETPIFNSVCLLSSSITIHLAERYLGRGNNRAFQTFWLSTLALGAIFLVGTGLEWNRLIYAEGLTISTNLFGTTYYALVGLHAFHLVVGLIMLAVVLAFSLAGRIGRDQMGRIGVLSMYWHFVDAVWAVV